MSKVVFNPPTPDSPGYLRRQLRATEFQKKLKGPQTEASLAAMVEFLLPCVVEPEERDAAREALWDATEKQFFMLLEAMLGGHRAGDADAKKDDESPNP